MTEHDAKLSNAMRVLAESEPREAPAHVEVALLNAFRRRHRVRRIRRTVAAALGTAAIAAALFFVLHRPSPPVAAPVAVAKPVEIRMPVAPPSAVTRPVAKVHKPARQHHVDKVVATEFVALPYGDDSLVDESITIVRVEMPRSALRLAGFMVPQDRANERVQADVVLGADGLAHAVRFVGFLE